MKQLDQALVDSLEEFYRNYYGQEIKQLAQHYPNEQRSLRVDYSDVVQFNPDIADDLQVDYDFIKRHFESALAVYDLPIDVSLDRATVRFHNLPESLEVDISEIRGEHIGEFLPVRGIVSSKSDVKERIEQMKFRCAMCKSEQVIEQFGGTIQTPGKCDCGYDAWQPLDGDSDTKYRDVQLLELQEPPEAAEDVNGATLTMEVFDGLSGKTLEGERITANAVIRLDTDDFHGRGNPDRDRKFYLECKSVDKHETQFEDLEITQEDKEACHDLAESGDIYEKLIGSLAPWIKPDEKLRRVKLSVILQLFGGVRHKLPNGEHIRGDINVYLIGDAGTGKTQIGKHAKSIAPLGVYTSGKGATPAGMTATATETKDGWELDAGALVVADGGFAFVDEFDKMDKSVHQSMHEALESQQIPISKAGINTVLNARTTVLASSNPIGGEVNRFAPIQEQVEIERPLLSRFDLIFLLHDKVEEEKDREIAHHQHDMAMGEDETVDLEIDDELLQKYIAYGRTEFEPEYANEAVKQELVDLYIEKRLSNEDDEDAPTPITARVNDSYRRLAQASARARLSEEITMDDVKRVKKLVDDSLGDTAFDEEGTMDATKGQGGTPKSQKKRRKQVKKYVRENDGVTIEEVANGVGLSKDKASSDIQHWMDKGHMYEPKTGKYRVT